MSKKTKRLKLNRDTIKQLEDNVLRDVVGGEPNTTGGNCYISQLSKVVCPAVAK